MKKCLLLSFMLVFGASVLLKAQTEPFKPNGTPEFRIFTNFTSTFTDGKNFNKFDVTRAYLGYIYNFSKTLTGRVTLDVGNPSSGKFNYTALLKFAYLQYHKGKLSVTGGMLSTPQYELGDKRWGYRYVYKTSHDEYAFGPSADLGLSAVYNFTPGFSADLILVNGEGFKLSEIDSVLKTGLGVTYIPMKNLLVRGYYDTMKKGDNNQQTLEAILSFENKKLNLTAVFNHQKDRSLVHGQDISGFSLNGSLFLKHNMKLFGRFDDVYSSRMGNAPHPWNYSKDGRLYLAGFEFLLAPGVRLAPNFQGWEPANGALPFISRFALNAEIRM